MVAIEKRLAKDEERVENVCQNRISWGNGNLLLGSLDRKCGYHRSTTFSILLPFYYLKKLRICHICDLRLLYLWDFLDSLLLNWFIRLLFSYLRISTFSPKIRVVFDTILLYLWNAPYQLSIRRILSECSSKVILFRIIQTTLHFTPLPTYETPYHHWFHV